MAGDKGRGASRRATRPDQPTGTNRKANRSDEREPRPHSFSSISLPERSVAVPEHRRCRCPRCGRNALCFDRKTGRYGDVRVLLHCWGCHGGVNEIHAKTDIPKVRLLTWPPPDELGPWTEKRYGRRDDGGPPEELPTQDELRRWRATLWQLPKAMRYLMDERGLTIATIREHGLGYGRFHYRPAAFMLPIFNGNGELVSLKERYWPKPWVKRRQSVAPKKEIWKRNLLNRPRQLYPIGALRKGSGGLIVCEGELDALLLNQALSDIPAVTGTAGTSWNPEWDRYIAGKCVAVVYDAGPVSFNVAKRRAQEFLAAGAREAWAVDLRLAEMRDGEDITDWFMRYGRSAEELRAFINASRTRAES
jgi:hypothetical protein